VTILRGATIGSGARILPGSVVAGEILAGAVAGGIPARPLDRVALEAGASPAPEEAAPAAPSAADRLRRIVARSFQLQELPPLSLRPADLIACESLGTLRLILELEDAFGVSLGPDDLLRAGTLADLLAHMETSGS
jgi:acyl carrier protein